MRSRIGAVITLTATLLIPAVVASAAPLAPAAQENKLQLFRSVQRQVLQYPHYTVFDSVSVQIDNGTVTLIGKVTMPYKRSDIERRVAGVAGVRQVVNQIEVLPVSKGDDDLRLAIARAIYGHPTFRPYASMVNPPIHIIVERNRVTLEGVVNDEAERLLARSIARTFDAFQVTDLLKTEAEASSDLENL
ncbi:MAG TPA: BON domain-containing protein [Vicinamibacterales bacterium]|nr:BON domain-containing protein [Vicinamibacterales bacterium]